MSEPLSDSALDQLFRTARTYNGYLDKPVSETQLHAIWDLMKFGPTSANSLPARIIWCVSDEAKAKLAALAIPGNEERSEEHTSELVTNAHLVCRLLLEKQKTQT